jgi:uncharacterized membrane protein
MPIAIALAVLFFGERLGVRQMIGAGLILAGTYAVASK